MFRFCSTFRGTAILEPGWPHDPGFSRWTFIRRGRRNVRVIRPLKGSCLGESWRAQNMDKKGNSNWYLPQSSTYNRIAMYNLLVGLDNAQEMAWKSCNWSSVIHFPRQTSGDAAWCQGSILQRWPLRPQRYHQQQRLGHTAQWPRQQCNSKVGRR